MYYCRINQHRLLFQVRTAEGIKILAFDKICDNGVIHTLAGVMMPPEGDIVNIVSNHNETSTLLSLAVAAGIAGALQGTDRLFVHGTEESHGCPVSPMVGSLVTHRSESSVFHSIFKIYSKYQKDR
ncbi:hypothetical protein DPMN_166586 [Dreissena polymorpha]|uniref:FAS1 domain-containing protein n=1 Tax=Dreissena polymorpha TaxID=45954 RepID=A0A9D4EY82_DREPO|nr:hypothetical protein DPMN_166586 [Dreissena polymorpha]